MHEKEFQAGAARDESGLFAELVDQLAEQLRAGSALDVEDLYRTYPECAERLRLIYPTLLAMRTLTAADDGRAIGEDEEDFGTGASDKHAADEHGDADLPFPQELGSFQLTRPIGRGGMGVVYLGRQRELDRLVAIKVLPFAALLDRRHLERFKLEARAAAMLKHPNIVSVFSFGVENGIHYYVMEYIPGVSLDEIIAERRAARKAASSDADANDAERMARNPQTGFHTQAEPNVDSAAGAETTPMARISTRSMHPNRAYYRSVARMGGDLARALHYAHQNGVVHRDIKPSNILLDDDGNVSITDFGLARVHAADNLTLTGDLLGTLRYMSPEQLSEGGVVDGRTDVYSLGLTLYELLAGRPAYGSHERHETRSELLRQVLESEPPHLRTIDARIPRDLAVIVHKACAKEVDARYRSAADFADDLQAFIEQRQIRARPTTQVERIGRFMRRNPRAATLIGMTILLSLMLAGVSSLLAWNFRHQIQIEAERSRRQRSELYARDMRAAKQAADEADWLELQDHLLRWVPGPEEVDLRGFEWFHLWQFCENVAVQFGVDHEVPVYQVAYLPDGGKLATGNFSSTVHIWSLDGEGASGPLREIQSRSMEVGVVVMAKVAGAADPLLVMGDISGNVSLCDAQTFERVDRFQVSGGTPSLESVTSLCTSRDGERMFIGVGNHDGGGVFVRDLSARHHWQLATLPGGGEVGLSHEGDLLVAAPNLGELRVYSSAVDLGAVASGPVVGSSAIESSAMMLPVIEAPAIDAVPVEIIPLDASGCYDLAVSPDGTLVALALYESHKVKETYRVEIWSTSNRVRLWSHPVDHRVGCVAFSPSGTQLAWGSDSGKIEIARLGDVVGDTRLTFSRKLQALKIFDVAFSPNEQQLATANSDGYAMVWDLAYLQSGKQPICRMGRDCVYAPGTCFLDRDGSQVATAVRNVGLVVWDAESGDVLAEPAVPPGGANHIKVASAPEHGIACVVLGQWPYREGATTPIWIWDQAVQEIVGEMTLPHSAANSPTSCHMSPDGELLAVSTHRHGVHIFDVTRRTLRCELDLPGKTVRFSRDGRTLVCGTSDGYVQLYSVPEFQTLERVHADDRLVDSVDISPDGNSIAIVGLDRKIKIYKRRARELEDLSGRLPAFCCLIRFSPDGSRLLTGSLDGKLRLWAADSGEPLLEWSFPPTGWPVGEFSPTGDAITASGIDIAHVIHAPNTDQLRGLSVTALRTRACQDRCEGDER